MNDTVRINFSRGLDEHGYSQLDSAVKAGDTADLIHVLVSLPVECLVDGNDVLKENNRTLKAPILGLAYLGDRALREFDNSNEVSFIVPGTGWMKLSRLSGGEISVTTSMSRASVRTKEAVFREAWEAFSREVSIWLLNEVPRISEVPGIGQWILGHAQHP